MSNDLRSLWPTLFLLPGLVALFIAVTAGPWPLEVIEWCRNVWWALLVCGSLPWLAVLLLRRIRRLLGPF